MELKKVLQGLEQPEKGDQILFRNELFIWDGEEWLRPEEKKEITYNDMRKAFIVIIETLSEGIHEPAGRNAGYGIYPEDQERAFKLFTGFAEKYDKQK